MFAPIYFDHNATTPLAAEVLAAMLPFMSEQYGNPSSRHEYGRAARRAVDEARQQVAAAVGAHPTELIFTSGGSEANNLFIKGAAACFSAGTLAISAIEHPCVREPARQLQRVGWRQRSLKVDAAGRLASADFQAAVLEQPRLVSVMLANNESGVVQDIEWLATQAPRRTTWFHTDAVQAFGKLPLDFRRLNSVGVHAMSLSAHKIGGPKGIGALVLDKRVELQPQIAGGGHERGLRSGTENVAAIVGFGVAAQRAQNDLSARIEHLSRLRDRLEHGLRTQGATIFGAEAERLPNTSYFAFTELDGETLVGKLDRAGFAVAAGAACSSANPEPSHVLLAMDVPPPLARGAVRISLGAGNTLQHVDDFLTTLNATRRQLMSLTSIAANIAT